MHMNQNAKRTLSALLSLGLLTGLTIGPMGCASTEKKTAPTTTAVAASKEAPPIFLYKAKQDGKPGTVYLLGSVHMQPVEGSELNPAVTDIAAKASEFVYEIPATDPTAEEQQQMMMKAMLLDGSQLSDHVSPETMQLYTKAAEKVGFPLQAGAKMKPWFAGLALSITFLGSGVTVGDLKFEMSAGVEEQIKKIAGARDGVTSSALESVNEQIAVFDGLSKDEADAFLRQACDEVLKDDGMMARLVKAYRAGDEDGVHKIAVEDDGQYPELARFQKALLHDRNIHMAERSMPYFDKDQITLVTIGVAHVLGEDSVLALLKKNGVAIERVDSLP